MSAAASSSDSTGLRSFSGDSEDAKEYKRWKVWVSNKLLTVADKVPEHARGAYVYTLLSGKALECVEHLDPSSYQKKDGEKILFERLDQRFPQKDASDEMSEVLTEVFAVKAHEGESLKAWISRATELFERCQRKVNVNFPEEARGWMILHRSGLSDEQKAVVLARSLGVLKREEIGRALRSCYPDFIVGKRRAAGISLIEDSLSPDDDKVAEEEFDELEQFLAEHQVVTEEPDELFDEPDVAEALAVSWKERRKQMGQLQRARRFKQAQDVRRSFKVEIEELKRRTKCNKCGAVEHWARECKSGKGAWNKSASSKGSSKGKESAAAMVVEEHFIAMIDILPSTWRSLQWLREKQQKCTTQTEEQLLVSSPGFGVLDSGCGRSIIGYDTLQEFKDLWKARQMEAPEPFSEVNHFKYGNGHKEMSKQAIRVPVNLGGRVGTIKAAIVQGQAPLLISRSALKTLEATINFETNELTVFDDRVVIPLATNQAGQYTVDLLGDPQGSNSAFEEVMMTTISDQVSAPTLDVSGSESPAMSTADLIDEKLMAPDAGPPSSETASWSRVDTYVNHVPSLGKQGPRWNSIKRRIVTDLDTHEVLFDEAIDPNKGKARYRHALPSNVFRCQTEFLYTPQEECLTLESLPKHHLRQLEAIVQETLAVQTHDKSQQSHDQGKTLLVAEVFSPPRFSPVVESMGFAGRSYDLINGYDFRRAADRFAVKQELSERPPKLLVLCPPCTDEGGWFNLNSVYMAPAERARRIAQSRMYIRFCCQLFEQQVRLGRRVLLEHPQGSKLWTYPEVQALSQEHHLILCHMCRYGLRLPGSDKLLKKGTHLLVSHEDMKTLAKECPGQRHPKHSCHQHIAGSVPGVGQVSTFAGQYTHQFVEAVLSTIPLFRKQEAANCAACPPCPEQKCQEVLMAKADLGSDVPDDQIKKVLDRLRRNLGHPPVHDLIRLLKHAQASQKAIELARQYDCDLCKSQIRPHVPLPAKTSRVSGFNQVVGLDVKNIPGWLPNQKIKALNIVCHGSCYQLMIPFFQAETSELLRKLFTDHWLRIFGPPKVVVLDQARTNMGDALQNHLDLQGTEVRQIAGEAHWQLGRTEVHGGWFARILTKVIAEHTPENQKAWEECVTHAHVKNQMIQNYGYTPHQHVFGQNPRIPSDLLDEPLHVVPATASLDETSLAQAQAIRLSARRAVIEMQDSMSLRRALAARPRLHQVFEPGSMVAYWRHQKFQQGHGVVLGGKWYGTAIVIGQVGRNYVIAHRKHIFRCAPEQLRPATSEESTLVKTPQSELLGIKDLIQGGTFRSQNFVDLVPGHYPPELQTDQVGEVPMPSDLPVAPGSVRHPVHESDPSSHHSTDVDDSNSRPPENPLTSEKIEEEPPVEENAAPGPALKTSSYGPVRSRSRVPMKSGPAALFRPRPMLQDDFVDLMTEVVPRLITEHIDKAPAVNWEADPDSMQDVPSGPSSGSGLKRSADSLVTPEEPPAVRAKTDEAQESLTSQLAHEVMSVQDCQQLMQVWDQSQDIEVLIAAYLQKKASKEIPAVGNEPLVQQMVDESKLVEWSTLMEKGAIRVHTGKKAAYLRNKYPERFMGSRFVIVRKPLEENLHIDTHDPSTFRIKSRWCLQGHLDPDLDQKLDEGLLQSPTLSQMGRMILMQVICSHGWDLNLQLGDIRGAFLEAGPLPERFRPLFAKQPQGGIPGVESDAVLEVIGNVYGQNDAPSAWHRAFDQAATNIGWEKSTFDSCLYFLRDQQGLVGIMGVHVDDTAIGGKGTLFEKAVQQLKDRFPYRKWRVQSGEFCGAFYTQDPKTKSISMSQQTFAEGIRPAHIPKGANNDQPLNDQQTRVLRAINGSLNWITTQSRPDASVQTSLSQQCFPRPTIKNLREANNAVRRIKQHKDLTIRFHPIDPSRLRICCHSDAAFANVGTHTQAGYVLSFVDKELNEGKISPWTPIVWRSYKLPRAVSSTLAGESQALSTASGTVEWMSLVLSEALDGSFEPRQFLERLQARSPILTTDCKSLYDHLISPSSPTAVEDRRTSIDIVIIRESIRRLKAFMRWLPTNRMLADALTKDKLDPVDLLRACMRSGTYQISPEEHVLAQQAAERELRMQRRQLASNHSPDKNAEPMCDSVIHSEP